MPVCDMAQPNLPVQHLPPPGPSCQDVPQPRRASRAEPQSILLLFCKFRVIIICIKFDCLNRSGLIDTNTQKCALPVISHSLANSICKIALDFNSRLLVLERCAHFISNCQRSPLLLVPLPLIAGALGSEILVESPDAP